MPSMTELQEKRGRLVTQARAALEEIRTNTDESRAIELDRRHDAIMADFDRVDAEIDAEWRVAMRPNGGNVVVPGADHGAAPEYRAAFHAWLAARGDVGAMSYEHRAALGAEVRMQVTGTGSAGGYTVPTELARFIVEAMKASGPMYDPGVTTELNTSGGNPFDIPTVDDTDVTAEPHTEGTPLTDDGSKDVTFGQRSLGAYGYDTEFVKVSYELTQDSIFAVEAVVGGLLGKRLGRIANTKLTVGTGTNEPHGIVTASSLGVTAAAANAIVGDELIDLYHSVDPAYRSSPRCGWQFNDTTLLAFRKLKDGEGNYLWQMGNVKEGEPDRLLGKPYWINQAVPSLATSAKPVLFGDFGTYYVRKVGAPVIGVLRERFWPDLGIAGIVRFDGELADTTAVKHLIMA